MSVSAGAYERNGLAVIVSECLRIGGDRDRERSQGKQETEERFALPCLNCSIFHYPRPLACRAAAHTRTEKHMHTCKKR